MSKSNEHAEKEKITEIGDKKEKPLEPSQSQKWEKNIVQLVACINRGKLRNLWRRNKN